MQRREQIDRPVDLARLLKEYGTSLKEAHAVIESVASDVRTFIELRTTDVRELQRRFRALGVTATPIARPTVDVAAVRRQHNLPQLQFAWRFGFDVETVQAWERGDAMPDDATQVLLAVIQHSPEIVDAVLAPIPAEPQTENSRGSKTVKP